MTDLLADRTAVVTGGASGIGRAISTTFAAHGANVVVADLRETPRGGDVPTHEYIRDELGGSASYVECDVTDTDDLAAAVDAADEFGGIDVMVNNAGILGDESFPNTSEEAFDLLMDVNVKGVYFGSQIAARRMLETGGGSIVNMSSELGTRGSGSHVVYSASKGAVRLMTYSLADALGPDVRVNAIHPGTIRTQMNVEDVELLDTEQGESMMQSLPLERFGEPEDIANAALYLASDLANYVTAASIPVDGGRVNVG